MAELHKRTLFHQENCLLLHSGVVMTYNAMLQLRQVVLTIDKFEKASRLVSYKELLRATSSPESQLEYFDIRLEATNDTTWRICKAPKMAYSG